MHNRISTKAKSASQSSSRLRPMTVADLPSIMELEKHCYATPWPAYFFRRLLRTGASCWVAEISGAIIAYGIVCFRQNWAHFMNLCVARAYRRRGVGRRMMLYLFDVARSRGANHAWLEVRTDNRGAIALYKTLGFRTKYRSKGYYRHSASGQQDALVMACSL